MHLSLCDQMAEFVNLWPLGQDRKNEALITKRSMAFSNGQLTSVIKMRSCLLPFTLCFTSMHQLYSFCLYFDSRRIHELDFLLQLACLSLTPRCLIQALRCINHLVHSEFPISALPPCTVLIMISARVIGLRSLESDFFFTIINRRKMKNFSPSAAFAI